jgi:hypothetical protein
MWTFHLKGWKMKIWIWKWILKRRYLRYRSLLDEMSCGKMMAEYVSPRVFAAKLSMNQAILKLNEIDSTCHLKEIS